jgi:hypothetical protein
VLQDLDLGAPAASLGETAPVAGTITITAIQDFQGGKWVNAGPRSMLTKADSWRPGHSDAPPDLITAGDGGITWAFNSRPAQDAILTSVNRPYPLPAVVSSALVGPSQTQATGTGLDGGALGLKVIAAAVAVPGAPANGVIVDRRYAELAAGLTSSATTVEQVWLGGGDQQAIEARLQAAGVSIASSSSTAATAAAFARQGPALSSVLFLADAAAATLLAAGAAILDLYLSARRRRYEYAALSASGVSFRTLRRAVRTELALLLGFGIVVGVAIGAVAALVTLHSLPEFINAPPAAVLSYVPPALPLVVMLVVAVAVLTAAAGVASSTLIRGVSLDQLRETPT